MRQASDVGTVKSLRSTRRCCSQASSRCASVFATTATSCNAPLAFTTASTFAGCSTAIRCFYHMVGNPNLASCARVGTRTVKTLSSTCSRSARLLIRFHPLRGMPCGAIVIATKVTATSRPSAPLFMHQYSHAWIDFRNRRETKGDRIDASNSVAATLAHRAFCMNLGARVPRVWTRHLGHHRL